MLIAVLLSAVEPALARELGTHQRLTAGVAGFERLRELGAPEKAIIFTDSTVTQQYIAR